jgi:hypothetical protein
MTIHTLCLQLCEEESYFRLLNIHFPQLRSLIIAIWIHGPELQTPPRTDFTDFILNHDTLAIVYGESKEHQYFLDYPSLPRLRVDSLPNLCTFNGNPHTFEVMAQARMTSLETCLSQLHLSPTLIRDTSLEFERMFASILYPNVGQAMFRLSALKSIELDMSGWDETLINDCVELIRQCARCCGDSLEVWRGHLPRLEMNVELLAELFGRFKRIQSIHLHEQTLIAKSSHRNQEDDCRIDIEANVSTIASSCLELREVVVQRIILKRTELWTVARIKGPEQKPLCNVTRHVIEDIAKDRW